MFTHSSFKFLLFSIWFISFLVRSVFFSILLFHCGTDGFFVWTLVGIVYFSFIFAVAHIKLLTSLVGIYLTTLFDIWIVKSLLFCSLRVLLHMFYCCPLNLWCLLKCITVFQLVHCLFLQCGCQLDWLNQFLLFYFVYISRTVKKAYFAWLISCGLRALFIDITWMLFYSGVMHPLSLPFYCRLTLIIKNHY